MNYYIGPWSNKRRVYYPTPEALARGAEALEECGRRLLIAPENIDSGPWVAALHNAHFQTALVTQMGRFQAYEVVPNC